MPSKKKKKERPPKKAPAKVNNYLKNKPTMARSINIQPVQKPKRDVEEVKPVVNAKVADEKLIHKPVSQDGQTFFPVLDKGAKDGLSKVSRGRKRSSRSTKKEKEEG